MQEEGHKKGFGKGQSKNREFVWIPSKISADRNPTYPYDITFWQLSALATARPEVHEALSRQDFRQLADIHMGPHDYGNDVNEDNFGKGKKGKGKKGDWKTDVQDNRNIGQRPQDEGSWSVYGKETWTANPDGLKYAHTTLASPGGPGGTQHSKEMKEHAPTEHPMDPWAESAAARRAEATATASASSSAAAAATGPAAEGAPRPAPATVLS